MDVKLATLIKSLNIMDVIFSGFTVTQITKQAYLIQSVTEEYANSSDKLCHTPTLVSWSQSK